SDLVPRIDTAELDDLAGDSRWLPVSAKHGAGLFELRATLRAAFDVSAEGASGQALVTRLRHRDALAKAAAAVGLALGSIARGQPPEVVAVDAQDGLDHIGEVTGAISNEDVLDRIFSRFCLGK
ncbi:MAG TPA: hypothetical protein VEB21_06445, partial [Terriglobales bacterium]|nr:hypothetical protein [Terriglobales bacterium]